MKYILFLSLVFLISCGKYESFQEKHLKGKHELMKMNVKDNFTLTSHSSYFLISGQSKTNAKTLTTVKFYIKNYRGEYMLIEKPQDKVYIKPDSTITVPYVKFYYYTGLCNEIDVYDCITRVVIYCNTNDFTPEIHINDLK